MKKSNKRNYKPVVHPQIQNGGGIPVSCYIIMVIIFIAIIYLIVLRNRVDEFFTNQNTQNTISNQTNSTDKNISTDPIFITKEVNPFEIRKIWQGKLPKSDKYLSFWQRKNKQSVDKYSMGQFAMVSRSEIDIPDDYNLQNSPVLNILIKGGAFPLKYVKIWSSDMIQNNNIDVDLSIWQPIPPDGYVSMGDIAVASLSPPHRTSVVCLPMEDLIKNGQIKRNILQHKGTDSDKMSLWRIGNYSAFMASNSESKPENRVENIMDISETLMTKKEYDPEETHNGLHVTISTSKLN